MTGVRTALAAALLLLSACSATDPADDSADDKADPAPTTTAEGTHGETASPDKPIPLRKGERLQTVTMPAAYAPSAPYGEGTDDYRCFLLDPKLARDMMLTGIDVKPGNPDVVHHVILFRVPPKDRGIAEAADQAAEGEGWTCFGGAGLGSQGDQGIGALDTAPWIGAWAPGGGEQVHVKGVGIPLPKGSRVIMQVHYNLLAGKGPDTSSALLRLAPADGTLDALETVLLPAPVELPCRPGKSGELCDRDAAIKDNQRRFGTFEGQFGNFLHLLCGPIKAGDVQTCAREASYDMTVRAAAGHMHLLGREIAIAVYGRRVLQIPVWDFDDQGAEPVKAVRVKRGDELTVTCRHDQALRDRLPAFEGQPERYVVWGEGTTDEMCLGILLVTRG